jgi:hypothetical protein
MENPTEIAYIRNKLRAINNVTTVSGSTVSTVGLNIYQIYPKTIIYPLTGAFIGGNTGGWVPTYTNSAPYQFLGAGALYFSWRNVEDGGPFNIGRQYLRDFNIYTTTAVGTKFVDVEYINTSGDLVFQQNIAISNNSNIVSLSAVNINRLTWSDDPNNTSLGTVHVIVTADTDTVGVKLNRNSLVPSASSFGEPYVSAGTYAGGTSVITVPNGYVGIISNVYMSARTVVNVGADIQMIIKDKQNNIKHIRYCKATQQTPTTLTYESFGPLNHPLEAGDNVFFGLVQGQITSSTDQISPDYNILIIVDAVVTLTAV